jgi:GT2 family glycosyltransferase
MISIITAIYNQLDMNKLFWVYLNKYTDNGFELIIVDNGSQDGSREFFQSLKGNVTVIANDGNYSYPHCQNQGLAIAKYDMLAFFNNDILVPPHWDSRITKVLGKDNQDVVSLSSNDRLYDKIVSKKIKRNWKHIKYPIKAVLGQRLIVLKFMAFLCYGNWERFTNKIFQQYGYSLTIGFSGSAIIMNRRAIEKLGSWDSTQQSADFDLFFRTCLRSETVGDIKPLAIINGVYNHHFSRMTFHKEHPEYKDADHLKLIDEKWNEYDLADWKKLVNFEY